jgi:uncharacterized membrane protein
MFWVLAASYTVHLLATMVWFGSLLLLVLGAWPAWRGAAAGADWFGLQKRMAPWANMSLVLLLLSGFVQMTQDPNYNGFLAIDSTWAWAMLFKHLAFLVLGGVTVFLQFSLYPGLERVRTLAQQRPLLAEAEREVLRRQENRLLRVNLGCALVILVCTAMATAV